MNSDHGQRRVRPTLETLETRLNLDAAGYVQSLYFNVLGRTAEASEVATHVQSINNGASAESIAQAFWLSEEHRSLQVDAYYQHYLRRDSDSAGRTMFVQQFLAGATENDVQRQFLTSIEYGNSHPTDVLYLEGLYGDVLGRLSDTAGRDFWLNQSGATRGSVANAFLNSAEANEDEVNAFFQAFLNRNADAEGASFWNAGLNAGLSTSAVAVGFLSSTEYIQLTSGQPTSALLTPALTEGESFRDSASASLNRSNLTTGTTRGSVVNGTPLTLTLNLARLSNGLTNPLSGVRIDVWQADALGNYSDEAASGTSGEAFLRGYQFTDANGSVTFRTIMPGSFAGRTGHLNVKIRSYSASGAVASEFNTQLFFDDAILNAVYANSPYSTNTRNTTNATDAVYNTQTPLGIAGNQLQLSLLPSGTGYATAYTILVP